MKTWRCAVLVGGCAGSVEGCAVLVGGRAGSVEDALAQWKDVMS